MESTAFEILVLPASLSSLLVVVACWLTATIVGWFRRLFHGEPEGADGWREDVEWGPDWPTSEFVGSRFDPS